MVKIKCANNPSKLQSELKELNKVRVIDENLHEIKQEILVDYGGDFQLIEKLSVGDQIREIPIRFRNITDYERFIFAIDERYDAEDAIFNGYIYKINTPLFNLVNRSHYGNGCGLKQKIIEYRGENC